MSWTEERTDRLEKLWREGLSASQIAAELGGLTRNAVVGKAHRLGLPGRRPSTRRTPRPRPKQPRRNVPRAPQVLALKPEPTPDPAPVVPPPEPVTAKGPPGGVSLLELTETTCRWPIGDPGTSGFHFCGAEIHPGRIYCDAHCAVAYRPAPESKTQRCRLEGRNR